MGEIITFTGIEYSGRTTTLLNMAYLLASEGCRVLFVDADQTRGKVAAALNLEQKQIGISEAVTGLNEKTFDNCFINDKKTGVNFITLPATAKGNDLFKLSIAQAEDFYQKIKKQFDYILIDSGNILYETLSGVSLFEADKIFIVLPSEKRGAIWLRAMDNIIDSLEDKSMNYVVINLSEIPEIPEDHLTRKKQFKSIPYVFNMREYTAMGELFIQRPTGKKAQDYVNAIKELIAVIKEQ